MSAAQLEPIFRKPYILGGNATVTVVSKQSGTRFTYRVRSKDVGTDEAPRTLYFVSVLNGPDNCEDYAFLGTIFEGNGGQPDRFAHGKKSRIASDAPSAKAFDWTFRHLDSDQIELWHEGKCSRCGRKLTTPESIQQGLGPVCAERV